MYGWLAHSLTRYYPASPVETRDALALEGARGERLSFQALFHNDHAFPVTVSATVKATAGIEVRLRRIGYVPQPHFNSEAPREELEGVGYIPGYVPDPLFPESEAKVGAWETQGFWITVQIPTEAEPGAYPITVTLAVGEETVAVLTATVTAHAAVLPARKNFPVTHWFYADALLDWYKLQPFEERFWQILEAYFRDLTAHGQDTIYVPVFTPPLDGVKRPTQLLHVTRDGDRYQFDWSLVRRWVAMARACGLQYFEWTHLFTQWGVKYAIRIYHGRGEHEVLLWPAETGATSDIYRHFLAQFLPAFAQFLQEEGLLERSFFHLSDEPHGEEHLANYCAARDVLRELAPWMSVMDALSEISFARQGVTDIPVPSITTAPDFVREGFPAWAYFCCGPRGPYLNRLLDTPLTKVRMSGWLFYRLRAQGFLHWGYNYWYESQTRHMIDPFTVTDGLRWPGWAYGDTHLVYPGTDGPVDSLRWEIFAESLQDYALLQAVELAADDPLLAEISDYAVFPRDADWIRERRHLLLARLDAQTTGS